mgnify:CR=1 FL=1
MSATGWVVLGVLAVLLVWTVTVYNRLVQLRNRIANAFGQIDVQLKRRHDLIPNLVEAAKAVLKSFLIGGIATWVIWHERDHHHFSAGFHVGNDLLCFFFRKIFLRCRDQQASGVLRNRILCQQIQTLYIIISFLQAVCQTAV